MPEILTASGEPDPTALTPQPTPPDRGFLTHRKFVAFVVSATGIIILKRYGMSPEDLSSAYGLDWFEGQESIVDVLISAVLPGWFGWAWPNNPKRGILDYWRIFFSGIAAIVAAAVVVWML